MWAVARMSAFSSDKAFQNSSHYFLIIISASKGYSIANNNKITKEGGLINKTVPFSL
jgi:hypothetical protein